jgi:hypothetical protein
VQIVTGAQMIAAFGDEQTALVMYDTQTVPVKSAPGACVTVTDGKITYSRFVFDRARSRPPETLRAEQPGHPEPATRAGVAGSACGAHRVPLSTSAAIAWALRHAKPGDRDSAARRWRGCQRTHSAIRRPGRRG